MKKLFLILLITALGLSLCACPALEETASEAVTQKEVYITVGKVEPGMTVKDVLVEVTIEHQPVPCRVKLTGFVWDGYWEMAEDEPVTEDIAVRVDIFYSLPEGYEVDRIDVIMDCDGGSYDGTGSISNDAEGKPEAWSRAFYGKEPLPPETEPTIPQETQPQHVHSWTELPGPGIVDCTIDGVKNFTCSCGETKTEKIPAPGHTLKEWHVTPATCTDDGRKTTSCKHCGAGFTVDIPATGHKWSDWTKKTGTVHSRTCSACGAEEEARHTIPSGEVTCTGCGADIIN